MLEFLEKTATPKGAAFVFGLMMLVLGAVYNAWMPALLFALVGFAAAYYL